MRKQTGNVGVRLAGKHMFIKKNDYSAVFLNEKRESF
jgi:hypothetical protein